MKKVSTLFRAIFFLLFSANLAVSQVHTSHSYKNSSKNWLQPHTFDLSSFRNPLLKFGPMTRWWWPGNFVTKTELKREINLFADNGFAGVEVQPINLFIPTTTEEEQRKVQSWDTPEYYGNLRTVMEEARRRNLIVDVTNGSGWPPSAPNLELEDGFISLEFSDTVIVGSGKKLNLKLPQLSPDKNPTGILPILQAVLVTRDLSNNPGNRPIELDASTTKVVTSMVKNGQLVYNFDEGASRVIAFWAVFSGSAAMVTATPKPIPVVDHLDSTKILKLYNHLFGDRTGLESYYGNPMRSIFSDSYEFSVNRHYSFDFLSFFKERRGYDITPFLPANMQLGYNVISYLRPVSKPDFTFSSEDWRLKYDYDMTVAELMGKHFLKTSKSWTEVRGLLFRTQCYGLIMDMIGMTGLTSIPETESMLDLQGQKINLKIIPSGALLYNRPIVSAESVVFINKAYTTTPQKIKLAVDKLFVSGVNQIIYHGIPYRLTSEELGPEGWYPFSSPAMPAINFSSNLGEGNIFWQDQKEVNEYIRRVQYAMQSGKARADVLIYFPFHNVHGFPMSKDEILPKGYFKDVEAPNSNGEDPTDPVKTSWAKGVFPVINALESHGISWAWVNDASIQHANLTNDGQINIRGNQFQALILANDSIIELQTSERIKLLAGKGMKLLATGVLASKQPSFLNWEVNDKITSENIMLALNGKNSSYTSSDGELLDWLNGIERQVQFKIPYAFISRSERELPDGSRVQFIVNKSDKWQSITCILSGFNSSYWMDPTSGNIIRNEGNSISYELPPYGSVLLFASKESNQSGYTKLSPAVHANLEKELFSIGKWNVKADSTEISNSQLFDWKHNEQLKFSSAQGIYKSTFQWQQGKTDEHFFIDLGKVCFTAEVYLNNEFVGKRIYEPYMLDITKFLKPGLNSIEVRVTPGQLNEFIGKAKRGDKRYGQFQNMEDQVMSAGLIGPVVIRPENKNAVSVSSEH